MSRSQEKLRGRYCHAAGVARVVLATMLVALFVAAQSDAQHVPGLSFHQIDYYSGTIPYLNTNSGYMMVNVDSVTSYYGTTEGFLQVYTDEGWVVGNMWLDAGDALDRMATVFKLTPASGIEVTSLAAYVTLTPDPVNVGQDGLRVDYLVTPYAVSTGGWTDASDAPPEPPEPEVEVPDPDGAETRVVQPNAVNVQAADDQCAPMSIANSLAYLEERYGLDVEHEHEAGLRDNTLVGRLEQAMGRNATSRTNGDGLSTMPVMNGKMKYMKDYGLRKKLIMRHQGTAELGFDNEDTLEAHGCRSVNESSDNGHVTWDWIKEQIDNGEDVEIGYAPPGHFVRVAGYSECRGTRKLYLLHDKRQTDHDFNDEEGLVDGEERTITSNTENDEPLAFGPDQSNKIRVAISESADTDMDSIPNGLDNSPDWYNPGQEDANGDGVGDVQQLDWLQADEVGPYELSEPGATAGFGPVENFLPDDPDHKDVWFVGTAGNPSDADTVRVKVTCWAEFMGNGITERSGRQDTTIIPPGTTREVFGSTTFEFCPELVGVSFEAIDGAVVVMGGTFYHLCYPRAGACCLIRGDINHDGTGPDVSDLVYLVTFMFSGGPQPPCLQEADINGNGTGPDVSDLVYLVTFMFSGGPEPIPCE